KRLSDQEGRYFDTMETIRKAVAIRPSLKLRNEAIACLALMNLRMTAIDKVSSPNTHFIRFNQTLELYAQKTPDENILVRRLKDHQEIALIPSHPLGVKWLH